MIQHMTMWTEVIFNLFSQHCSIEVVQNQKQIGGKDCGLFAISNATALCFGQNHAYDCV